MHRCLGRVFRASAPNGTYCQEYSRFRWRHKTREIIDIMQHYRALGMSNKNGYLDEVAACIPAVPFYSPYAILMLVGIATEEREFVKEPIAVVGVFGRP